MLSDDELDISIMVYPESYPWIGDKRYKLGLTGEFVSKLWLTPFLLDSE